MKTRQRCWWLAVALLAAAATGAAVAAEGPDPEAARAARAASDAVQQAEPKTTPATTPAAPKKGKPPAAGAAAAGEKQAKVLDRLELERTQITGNRELPKVMVIVPWKRSDIGDLARRPFSSLVDEALQPVDRAAFRREVDYYDALAPDRSRSETPVTGGAPGAGPEK